MTTVGIRELKNRLSEYIRRAKKGEKVMVTDRGKVVVSISAEKETPDATEEALRRMEVEGLIIRPTKPRSKRRRWRPLEVPGKPVSQMVIEDRG